MKAVVDTNVLVDYLNGRAPAKAELALYERPAISTITWIEVMVGARPGEDDTLRSFLDGFEHVPVDSAVAMDAAETFDGVVINADSMQVYRDLRVLTARPSAADEARMPHRLFGLLPATERCSAGRWLGMAAEEIEVARGDGRLPIVVGGTGLYLGALTGGLAPILPIPEGVRAEAKALHARLGGEEFRAELAKLDLESATALPAGDTQRLIRAWEVVRATRRTLPDWQREATQPRFAARTATIVLTPPRAGIRNLVIHSPGVNRN